MNTCSRRSSNWIPLDPIECLGLLSVGSRRLILLQLKVADGNFSLDNQNLLEIDEDETDKFFFNSIGLITMSFRQLIENYLTNRDERSVEQIGTLLTSNDLSLIDFIEAIGDFLQSSELSKRSTALILLAQVLTKVPQNYLKTNEINHLLTFVTAKMRDHHILAQPAVELFHVLAKQTAISDEDCLAMIKSIFADVYVQSFPQSSRYNVYVILLHFLLNRLEVVREIGTDFVCNFIQSMDGERDPRNLVLCFQCIQYMIKHLEIEPYKEELFEVVACYFPMEYKPKTMNNGETEETITTEQLSIALRNIFTSTGIFAPFCLPMLIEKLESDIPTARLAAMDVFIHCIDEYDARTIKEYLVPIWNLFSKQALCAENVEQETMALKSITALMQLIGKSIQNDETEISTKKFVDRAIRECENFLKQLDLKLVWPATKVLQAVARANSTCASLIWSHIVPSLIKQFENLEQVNHKKTVLDMIAFFLQPTGIRTIVKLPSNVSEPLWILVSTYFDEFPGHSLTLIGHLLQLNTTPGQVLEDNLTKFILLDNISDELKQKLSSVLKMLGSSALFDRAATNLLNNLIQSWTVTKTTATFEVLSSCVDLCHNSERCQERLERFFVPSAPFIRLLPHLFKYLPSSYILTNLFSPMFDLLVSSILIDPTAKIFAAKCGSIADENCVEFVEKFSQSLLDRSFWLSNETQNILPTIFFIGNLKRKFFQNQIETIWKNTDETLLEQLSNETSEIFSCFYANLANKLSSNDQIVDEIQRIVKRCETSKDERRIFFWTILVKALILSRPAFIEQNVQTLISWMKLSNGIADFACRSLRLWSEFDDQTSLLSSSADCLVHPMVKQILFLNILNEMKPMLNNNELSSNQINTLVDILGHVPKSIIHDEIVSLLPILIRALSSSNESIWSSALNSICDLIKTDPNTIGNHLDALIPRLSALATYQKDMSIRIISLKCFKYLTNLPIHQIQPFRRQILHLLKTCVDDHKRLVRKQAVETRMSWCLLNA